MSRPATSTGRPERSGCCPRNRTGQPTVIRAAQVCRPSALRGTNADVIVEEAVKKSEPMPPFVQALAEPLEPSVLLPWAVSGRGADGVAGAGGAAGGVRAGWGGWCWLAADVGRSLAAGRSVSADRRRVFASGTEGFAAGLEAVAAGQPGGRCGGPGAASDGAVLKVAFVFAAGVAWRGDGGRCWRRCSRGGHHAGAVDGGVRAAGSAAGAAGPLGERACRAGDAGWGGSDGVHAGWVVRVEVGGVRLLTSRGSHGLRDGVISGG